MHNFSEYVYFFSLHVSGEYVPIVRRNNCIYATLGTCYSNTKCRTDSVISRDDGHIVA